MANAIVSRRISSPNSLPLFDQEIWKPIPGLTGYDASTHGRIRSWWQISYEKGMVGAAGRLGSHPTVVKGSLRGGYFRVKIRGVSGGYRSASVNCLVLETFVGPRPKGMVCRHYPDQDKANNRLDNLQWGTYSENGNDTARHKLARTQKLNPNLVKEMWPMLVKNESTSAVARRFGVSPQIVCDIKHYRCWSDTTKHLPGVPPGSERP